MIEDIEGNVFGGFVSSPIDNYLYKDNDEWKGSNITDANAFVFSLKSNGRLKYPTKFDIKSEEIGWAFTLYKQEWELLFIIGGGDICIKKDNYKTECYCHQLSFNYQGVRNVLVGKEGRENTFEVKRIQVWQMSI